MFAHPDAQLIRFARYVHTGEVAPQRDGLRLGVDLGTANIVLAVVDAANMPVAGTLQRSTVVRDGVIIDWHGAVQAVRTLAADLESRLATRFESAAVTIPPGIDPGTVRVFTNVIDACGLRVAEVVDEPVAAATSLVVRDGAVIDIGHGTTGVSLLADDEVVFSYDEATGGHHMTLVIAGALGLGYDEAEAVKKDPASQLLVAGLVRPTLEKMATIAADALAGHDVAAVHLVGGSSSFDGVPEIFETVLGRPVHRTSQPLFPTPLGVAMRRNHD